MMEQEKNRETYFDTPDRLTNEEILDEILHFKQNSLINQILEGFPELTLIVNKQRQIVAFNSKALLAFRTEDYFNIVGKRIGEAINCIHQDDNINGCGTSVFCRECGAARAIRQTIDKEIASNEECRITINTETGILSLDFEVHTQPLSFDGKEYTLFTVRDISSLKRKEALERVFFHDVLNTVQAVKGYAELLEISDDPESVDELKGYILSSSNQLYHEIRAQSALQNAENDRLEPEFDETTVNEVLKGVYELYGKNPMYNDRRLIIEYPKEHILFITDVFLAIRSLGNLIKNALEASKPNEEVKIRTSQNNNEVCFEVINNKIIPSHVQHQLFQRSFTTKQNKGHGIGLYSVRLIVQQFLKGNVEFVSDEINRTVFTIRLPLAP